ncbi:MAG: 50S ribosomal protein L1 [bacterium]
MKKVIHKKSKRMKQASEMVDKSKTYSLAEASELIKKTSTVKFDAAVDVHLSLGIDTKKSDQQVRGTVTLPHGNGKTIRIAAVALNADQQKAAKDAGADLVGEKELVEEIKGGKINFDILVATPEAMKILTPIAKVLGPKGLMPNPKDGTVAQNIGEAVANLKKGKVSFKNDNTGNLHIMIGRASFDAVKLAENIKAVIDAIQKAKPATAKGSYIKNVSIASSMGPGIKVSI